MLRSETTNKTVALCAAARLGDIKTLQRASKTALNWSDDEAMTPAMWSAARGQLQALRVIVESGYVMFKSCLLARNLYISQTVQDTDGHSYCKRLIGNRMRSIEWCYFQ